MKKAISISQCLNKPSGKNSNDKPMSDIWAAYAWKTYILPCNCTEILSRNILLETVVV